MAADEEVQQADGLNAPVLKKDEVSPAKETPPGKAVKKQADGKINLQDLIKTIDPRRVSSLNVVFVGVENLPPLFPEISDETVSVVEEYTLEKISNTILSLETESATEEQIISVLTTTDLAMPEDKARLVAGALNARSNPIKRSLFVAQHNLHSIAQAAEAVKDGVVGGASFAKDKVVEGARMAKDSVVMGAGRATEGVRAVASTVADDKQVLGSRRLKQLADAVAEPDKVVPDNQTFLGSRRLAGLKEVLFGPSQPEDNGIYGLATPMTEEDRAEAGLPPLPTASEELPAVKEGEEEEVEAVAAEAAGEQTEVREEVKEGKAKLDEGDEVKDEEEVEVEVVESQSVEQSGQADAKQQQEEEEAVEEKAAEGAGSKEKMEEEKEKIGEEKKEVEAKAGEASPAAVEEGGEQGKGKGKKGKRGKSTAL